MKKRFLNSISHLCLVGTAVVALTACTDDAETPRIDSVWMNMVTQPVEQVTCAYPGQTICLRGEYLDDLRRVIVNGTDINLNTLFIYESDKNITFQLPSDVSTEGDYIRVVTRWGMTDFSFIVRPQSDQPTITSFSSTTLIAGRTLTIRGTNLEGATEVWLPTVFDGRVRCELAETQDADGTTVKVIIPENVSFASGYCEIVMTKTDSQRGMTYTEKVYSDTTDFGN